MPAGNIVYKSSSSSSPRVTKHTHNEPIYARVIKKSNKVTPPKKGITRRDPRRRVVKRKPTKKNPNKSSTTVYKSLNLPKRVSKRPKRSNSVTYATLRFPNQRNTRSSNRENVNKVMKQVRNATPLSKNEAKKLLKNAMESK